MHHLLLLLVASLAVPPVLLQSEYQKLVWQHAHFRHNNMVDCNNEMNENLEMLNMTCLSQSTFILGTKGYETDLVALDKVCSSGGEKVGDTNHYKSKEKFRVVTCKRISGDKPPKCKYNKVNEANIETKHITVSCSLMPTSLISES